MHKLVFCMLLIAGNAVGADTSLYMCAKKDTTKPAMDSGKAEPAAGGHDFFIGDKPPSSDCRRLPLPVDETSVLAVKPLTPSVAASVKDQVLVQGQEKDNRFMVSEIISAQEKPTALKQSMPLRENLIPAMQWRSFGIEERMDASVRDKRLVLACKAGAKPAGIVLTGPWLLPMANTELLLSVAGNGSFEVHATDDARLAKEQPILMGRFDAGASDRDVRFLIPSKNFQRNQWHSFSIVCPNSDAMLSISGIQLKPLPGIPAARSAWVWNYRSWLNEPDAIFSHAKKYRIDTLFIALPFEGGELVHADRLAGFIHEASRKNMQVWSVDGDPSMVLPQEHVAAVKRAEAYARYNAAVEPIARLSGMQFDVEPYLLPDYAEKEAQYERQYAELVRKLKQASSGLPLEMVVPFWWGDKSGLLEALARHADSVNVMDYRTDPKQIVQFAAPFLDWAALHGKKVRVALEAGPIEEEIQRRYARAESGELWVVDTGQQPVMLLLKKPARNPYGPAFKRTAETRIDGSATTFHANPEKMLRLLPQLEADFSAWSSFDGIALHELK